MQISQAKIYSHPSQLGFSLLEILVVLAIMSTMLVLVSSRMTSAIEATRFFRTVDNAVSDIQTLRVQSMLTQYEHILLTEDQPRPSYKVWQDVRLISYDIPPDWIIEGDIIKISKQGLCSSGIISFISTDGRKASYDVKGPSCTVKRRL